MLSSSGQGRAVALQYGKSDAAPVVVASGLGHMAERIMEVAAQNNIPIYEDTALATVLSQLRLGQEIPAELYQAIVEIYVFFLRFDVSNHKPEKPLAAGTESAGEPPQVSL